MTNFQVNLSDGNAHKVAYCKGCHERVVFLDVNGKKMPFNPALTRGAKYNHILGKWIYSTMQVSHFETCRAVPRYREREDRHAK